MRRALHALPAALAALIVLGSVSAPLAADAPPSPTQPDGAVGGAPSTDEHAIASRLLAPCCWNQTLDVHTSDVAMNLRREIRTRLAAGEAPSAIEADLVARYGERIRAVPTGSPLGRVAATALVLVGLAGVGILLLGLRWRRRSRHGEASAASEGAPSNTPAAGSPGGRDAWDDRLDAELREL